MGSFSLRVKGIDKIMESGPKTKSQFTGEKSRSTPLSFIWYIKVFRCSSMLFPLLF